jgi:hypothetical protein
MFFYSENTDTIPLSLLVNSSSLTFTNTCIEDSSQNTFVVTATGNTTETITLSDDTDQYSFSPSSFILSNTGSETVTVTFSPTSWGVKTGSISISANGGSTQTVSLAAVCVANPLIITSSVGSVQFQNTIINQTSSATFTVSAGGRVQDIVLMSDNSDQFDFSPSSFSMTGANQTQEVTVYFTPTSVGSKIGLLTLSASGGDVAHVSLTGSATYQPFVLNTSTSSLTFAGNTAVGSQTVGSIQIWGSSTGATETVTISDNSANFSVVTSSLVVVGDGGNTKQTVNLRFTPTITGTLTGLLTLSSSGGSIKTVGLTGSGVEQHYGNTSLLLRGNGVNGSSTFTDSSPTASVITRYGNTAISTINSKYGGSSIYFDGNADYLSVPDNYSKFNFGTGSFTIEMWLNPAAAANGAQKHLFGKRASTVIYSSVLAFMTYSTTTGKYSVNLYAAGSNSTWTINLLAPNVVTPNAWTHLAFVRNGSMWEIYANGVRANYTTSATNLSIYDSGAAVTIGVNNTSGIPTTDCYSGYIDDFRITKGVARYTSNFTPPGPL